VSRTPLIVMRHSQDLEQQPKRRFLPVNHSPQAIQSRCVTFDYVEPKTARSPSFTSPSGSTVCGEPKAATGERRLADLQISKDHGIASLRVRPTGLSFFREDTKWTIQNGDQKIVADIGNPTSR
jgi:hypothetical protein